MPQSTAAGIITAIGTVLTALALVITAVGGYVRSKKVERKVEDVEHKVDGVHVIVNQQRTDLQRYQRALIDTLKSHGIEPPADQSVETPKATSEDKP